MYDNTTVLVALAVVGVTVMLYRQSTKSMPAPLPPGPKGLPLLGNVADMPKTQQWVTFAKWGEIYGPITHIRVLGTSIIILNSAAMALALLDTKSRLYSDRPTLTMAGRLVGWDAGPALIQTGETWSVFRRLFVGFMGTRAKVEKFGGVLAEEAERLVGRVRGAPGEWAQHCRRFAGAIVLTLAYGYTTTDEDDVMLRLVNSAMDGFSETTASGAFLVDVFPFLRHVPGWFPGAGWKRKASRYRRTLHDMLNAPYDWAKAQLAAGTARPNFLSALLDGISPSPNEEHIFKWAAAGIYTGGADTTVAALESFVLAMTLHPTAQHAAQAEFDAVLGNERIPTLSDRPRLPYFEALCLEVMRVYTPGPLGLPHVVREDDVHDGYFIPKGSIVIANVWQFFRDPKTYVDPEVFSPERFLGPEKETDPRGYLFGFGRRACPGIHLADASMWLACASLLAAFHMRPAVKDGKTVPVDGAYLDGSISHPAPFECSITPR